MKLRIWSLLCGPCIGEVFGAGVDGVVSNVIPNPDASFCVRCRNSELKENA